MTALSQHAAPDLHIVIFSDEPEVPQHARACFNGTARITVFPTIRRRVPKLTIHEGELVVLVDILHASATKLAKLIRLSHNGIAPHVIIGNSSQLMQSCDRLHTMLNGTHATPQAARPHHPEKNFRHAGLELSLGDFLERKFQDFVRKIRLSGGKDLMELLRDEFEKPLITLALRETRGNQVQAAELLGMNRNTLRKKMTALKISAKK